MTTTTATKRIRIIGREAADIARHVASDPRYKHWTEVQVMRECKHGCKLYARRRGCVTQYELFHSKAYGCDLGRHPDTSHIPVTVAPKGQPDAQADDQLLDQLGTAFPATALVDDQLCAQLLAWRIDVETEPLPDLVDVATAIATIRRGAA